MSVVRLTVDKTINRPKVNIRSSHFMRLKVWCGNLKIISIFLIFTLIWTSLLYFKRKEKRFYTCTGWLPVVVIFMQIYQYIRNKIFCVVLKLTLKIANLYVVNLFDKITDALPYWGHVTRCKTYHVCLSMTQFAEQ